MLCRVLQNKHKLAHLYINLKKKGGGVIKMSEAFDVKVYAHTHPPLSLFPTLPGIDKKKTHKFLHTHTHTLTSMLPAC